MKRLFLIIICCFTLGCAAANHTVHIENDKGGPKVSAANKSDECVIKAEDAAWLGIIAIETWWWFRIF